VAQSTRPWYKRAADIRRRIELRDCGLRHVTGWRNSLTPDLSVVIPCLNEEENLEPLVERIRSAQSALGIAIETILVDDGSTDGTAAGIRALSEQDPSIVGVFHEKNRGIAGGWKSGVAASTAPWVVFCDADLQYDPAELEDLWRCREETGADVVQGHRVYTNAFEERGRWLLSAGMAGLLKLAFGVRLRDPKSDFLMCRREMMLEILGDADNFRFFQHYIGIALIKRGCSVREVPVKFGNRHAGETFIRFPVRFAASALAELPKAVHYYRGIRRRSDQT
jgi:phenylacetate-CoA ligase